MSVQVGAEVVPSSSAGVAAAAAAAAAASKSQTFIADYTVRAITDVLYFRVSRPLYQTARSATLLERAQRDAAQRSCDLDNELEQVFNAASKEDSDLVRQRMPNSLTC